MKKHDSICPLPWVHTHIWPDGRVFPCCSWDTNQSMGNLHTSSLVEIFNNANYKKLRTDMMEGRTNISGCRRCNKLKSLNAINQQTSAEIDLIDDMIDFNYQETVENIDFKYVDFRFSNKCNLTCVTCGSYLSSAWAVEDKSKKPLVKLLKDIPSLNIVNDFIHFAKKPTLIYFAGGEPLIMEEHFEMLQYYIDNGTAKDIRLNYNTNLSMLNWNHKNVFEYWKHFKHIHVGASIDHFGNKLEYIRYPIKYTDVLDNISKVQEFKKQNGNLEISISLTLSILNAYDLLEIYEQFKDFHIFINLLISPEGLSIALLPNEHKKMLIAKYENTNIDQIVINELQAESAFTDAQIYAFHIARINLLNSINQKRKLCFSDYFHEEHFDWLLNIKHENK